MRAASPRRPGSCPGWPGRGSWRVSVPILQVLVEVHGGADLLHGPGRLGAGAGRAVAHHVADVVRLGEELLPLLAQALLVRHEPLEQLLLAVDATDPGGPAVVVHPANRLGRAVDAVEVEDPADLGIARVLAELAGRVGDRPHDLLRGRLG